MPSFDKAAARGRAVGGNPFAGVWLSKALDEIDRLEAIRESQQNRAHAAESAFSESLARICALEAALRKKAMDDHHEKHGSGRPFFADCLYPSCIQARQLLGEGAGFAVAKGETQPMTQHIGPARTQRERDRDERIAELEARIRALEAALRKREWVTEAVSEIKVCLLCGSSKKLGHDPNCELGQLLGGTQIGEPTP